MVVGFLTPQRNAMTLAAKDYFWPGINDLEVPVVEKKIRSFPST